jgi:hypothetical protein
MDSVHDAAPPDSAGRQSNRFVRWILPLILLVEVLIVLNVGLYQVMAPRSRQDFEPLPFAEEFEVSALDRWFMDEDADEDAWGIDSGALIPQSPGLIFAPVATTGTGVYRISTLISPGDGDSSAGLLFNGEYPHMFGDHHFVTLNMGEATVAVIAGYHSLGRETSQAGAVHTLADPTAPIELTVILKPGSYDVQIMGQTVLMDVPLHSWRGIVGLAVSEGSARFERLSVEEIPE